MSVPADPRMPAPRRRRRRRRFSGDAPTLVADILARLQTVKDERADWLQKRVLRYAKTRGWTERDHPPWDEASNVHVPVMVAHALRTHAGLQNAVLGVRPVMSPKVVNRAHREIAERANTLIDYQIFLEMGGEQAIDRYIHDFVFEGTAVSFQAWNRDTRRVHDVRIVPRPPGALIEAMAELIPDVVSPGIQDLVARTPQGDSWTGVLVTPEGQRKPVTIEVYDLQEDRIEIVLEWPATVYDGPVMTVHDLEDILVPIRSENTQPVTPANPFGAPWIARTMRVTLDHVRRKQRDGTYDLLTVADLDALGPVATGRVPRGTPDEDALKQARDTQAGLESGPEAEPTRLEWLTMVEWYGAYDLDGDGLNEEVIFWILEEPKLLCRARYLTEIFPGVPEERPFADARFIPVPGEFYGIGEIELMEGLHDLLHVLFNQNLDRGDLANQPFFFYRASSGVKPDVIRLWPGDGYPIDNPQTDVAFPTMPHADQTWSFNMIGLTMQFLERLTQMGPMQFGQVPTGKASALRTLGTTMAILQQGAALPEQVLRRLFGGLAQIWHQIHRMNGRYLPRKKQYLILGKSAGDQDAYGSIEDPSDLAVPITFGFEASLLNTNKGLVAQALTGLGAAVINPLTMQLGLVDAERIYTWAKDLIQAHQLDPARYLVRPRGTLEIDRLTFEEALLMIMENRLPEVAPLEPMPDHYQKALAFLQSEQMGLLTEGQVALFRQYLLRLTAAVRQDAEQQRLMAASQQFAATLGNQGAETQAPLASGQPPEMQLQMPTQDEIQGAARS